MAVCTVMNCRAERDVLAACAASVRFGAAPANVVAECGPIERQQNSSAIPEQHSLSYRPDIDGLRALAVLSVVAFHMDSGLAPGGYVGVDIFFVISGFLITSIICRSLEQDKFSFIDFYARRSKRIFPSLMTVMLAVWVGGWFILLPNEYEQLGKHIAAGAGFVSNFALWRESGYFDQAAESKPLLNLWSLGIEEQFYILWPPLVAWAWKRRADVLQIALVIVGVSFTLNVMLVSLWQTRDGYYLPPTRFWELLLGAALSLAPLFRKKALDDLWTRATSKLPGAHIVSLENTQATLGLVFLLVAIAGLNKETFFPGWWALLPTLGAALLISAGRRAWINRKLLASKPLVFIGLISYSLYLWHWPLLSYVYIIESGAPSLTMRLGAVTASFLLAWLTYRIVERPLRAQPNRTALFLVPALLGVGCLGLASFSHRFHARSEAYGVDKIMKAAGEWDFPGPNLKSFHTALGYHWEQNGASPRVLFMGDSNIEQYYPRINKLLMDHPKTTRGVVFVTRHACAPIPYMKQIARPFCAGLAEQALSLAQNPDIDTIVIGAAWASYPGLANSSEAFRRLEAMIMDFRKMGRRVYLILPIPWGDEFAPTHLVTRSLTDFRFNVVREYVTREKIADRLGSIPVRLTDVATSTGATAIDPVTYLCQEQVCPTLADDNSPRYMDNNHLRPSYVRDHVTFLDEIISNR